MQSQPSAAEPAMPYLLAPPEAYQDPATGVIRESYVLAGLMYGFQVGSEVVQFPIVDLRLEKTAENELRDLFIEIPRVASEVLTLIEAVTGPSDGDERAALNHVRFGLKPEFLQSMQRKLQEATSLSEFLAAVDLRKRPIVFDFVHYGPGVIFHLERPDQDRDPAVDSQDERTPTI